MSRLRQFESKIMDLSKEVDDLRAGLGKAASTIPALRAALEPFANAVHEHSDGVDVDRLGPSRLDFLAARKAYEDSK
jgi:hypothetical protein